MCYNYSGDSMRSIDMLVNNGINVQKSLEIFGDMRTYDESLEVFVDEIDEKLANIKKYKEEADMANYAILVHSLKSDSKYFGFEKLAELAYQHEMKSKENAIYYIYDNYDELSSEANRIVNIVKNYLGKEVVKEVEEVNTIVAKDKKILVVDDSNIIRNFIQKIFNNNFEVLVANDGKEALDIIGLDTSNKIIGMLLDLNMPNVDGFAVLDYFKGNNLFKKIPVFIITGENSDKVIDEARKYPITDVLAKPFNEKDIKEAVEKTVEINYQSNLWN